jgi:uncharacterized protein HemX
MIIYNNAVGIGELGAGALTSASSTETLFWKEQNQLMKEFHSAKEKQYQLERAERIEMENRDNFFKLQRLIEAAFNHIEELQKEVASLKVSRPELSPSAANN